MDLFILGGIVKTVQEDGGALVHDAAVRDGCGHAVDGSGASTGVTGVSHDSCSDLSHIFDELVRHPWLCVTPDIGEKERLSM